MGERKYVDNFGVCWCPPDDYWRRRTIGGVFWRFFGVPTQDHSCGSRNLLAAIAATITAQNQNPSTTSRTQVDHSCESRNLLAAIAATIAAQSPKPSTTSRTPVDHSCVGRNGLWGNESVWMILALGCCPPGDCWRRRTIGGVFWRFFGVPTQDHSCVGRNLLAAIAATIAKQSPPKAKIRPQPPVHK